MSGEGRWDPILFDFHDLPRAERAPVLDTATARVHPQDRDRAMQAWTRVRDVPGVTEWESRLLRDDGKVVHVVSRAYAERRADGTPLRVVGASFDVTESRTTAVALEQTLERLKVATETGRVGVWERDLVSDAAYWDPVLWSLHGLEPRDVGPSRAEAVRLVHPDDRATVDAAWRRLQQLRHVDHAVEFEFRVPRPDGSIAYLNSRGRCIRDATGNPLRVVGATIDVTASRSAQRQLREMDEFVKLASVVTGVGFFRLGLDSTATFTDTQLKRIFGFDPAGGEPSREAFESRVLPEDRAILHNARALVRSSTQPVETEYRIRLPDGALRHIFTRRALVRDEAGRPTHVVGTAIDVTSTRVAEQERERLAQRIEVATTELQLGLWEWDPIAHTSLWNDRMYALFGHARASFGDRNWLDAVHPDDRETARNELKAVVAEGRNIDHEFRIVRSDGEVRWIAARGRAQRDAQGLTTRVFGVIVDITERRSADLERVALSTRMQLAADAAHIGLWERDAEGDDGKWNAANFALWGLPGNVSPPRVEQVVNRVHPDDRAAFLAQFREAAAGREPDDLEYRVVHGDGRTVVLRTRVRPVMEAGRSLRVVGVNIDVTQQRLAEQALIAKETAERANEAKTEFLSRMSHELRTPLNAILGFAQLLDLNPAERLSPQQRANVDHIQKAGWHLVSLIDEVLDLARIESGRMALAIERVALQGVIEESLATDPCRRGGARPARRAAHAARCTGARQRRPRAPQAGAGEPAVERRQVQPRQRPRRHRGRGRPRAQRAHHRARHRPRHECRTARARLRALQPPRPRALGHCRHRHRPQHHAQARAADEGHHRGVERAKASVRSSWSRCRPPRRTPAAAAPAVPAGALRRDDILGTVLYVEDDESNVQLVEQLIALRPRVKLLVARDSTSARVLAAVTQPDIVLIDMRLPDASGIDVLHALRAQSQTARLPCIAVSANALPEDIAAARAAGFDDYLTKPLEAESFLARIDAALQRPARGSRARLGLSPRIATS